MEITTASSEMLFTTSTPKVLRFIHVSVTEDRKMLVKTASLFAQE